MEFSLSPASVESQSLIVMPEFNEKNLLDKITSGKRNISSSSIATLYFQVDEMRESLKMLKEYEMGRTEYSM